MEWPLDPAASLSERFAKRSRVSLACTRCKGRKSKCDGVHPSCSACRSANVQCQYPSSSKPPSKTQYIRALEDRILELESSLQKKNAESIGGDGHGNGSAAGDRGSQRASSSVGDVVSVVDNWDYDNPGSLVSLISDLSCDSGGVYVGASSNISMGRMISSVVKNASTQLRPTEGSELNGLSPKSVFGGSISEAIPITLAEITQDIADRLYSGFLQHISTRWPILHTPYIADLHSRRNQLFDLDGQVFLHLVYANGGRYLETTGETGNFFPQRHYQAAMEALETIVGWRDIRAVQTLLLLGIYSLRAPSVPGAWNFVGLAMRTCIELGLHRRYRVKRSKNLDDELSKRVFWSCYMLDRQISLSLGRPFALPDHDIDVNLPVDMNEEDFCVPENPLDDHQTTSLICFRQTIKMRQIESKIRDTIYRLDQDAGQISDSVILRFKEALERWRDEIPAPYRVPPELGPRPYDGHDYYLHFYYNCLRQLYFPLVLSQRSRYVRECAEACIGVCEVFKKLHRNSVVGYSLWALQTVFLAGLTLVYTIWLDPLKVSSQRASSALNDCNLILYVIVERWPMAKRYRDTFEEIKDSLEGITADKDSDQRRSLPNALNAVGKELLNEEFGVHDYDKMVLDMMEQSTYNFNEGHALSDEHHDSHSMTMPSMNMMNMEFSMNHSGIDFRDDELFDLPESIGQPGETLWSR